MQGNRLNITNIWQNKKISRRLMKFFRRRKRGGQVNCTECILTKAYTSVVEFSTKKKKKFSNGVSFVLGSQCKISFDVWIVI